MDTDWCIVCDTKIVLHHSASRDSHENEDEIGGQAEQPTMTTAVSAFCSQDCLIKSYLEAASQAHAYQHPEKTIGGLRRSQTNDSFMLHPGHSKKKLEAGSQRTLFHFPSNRKKVPAYPVRKKVVSSFTLNSCGSSSSTLSSS
ncbi:hypothetical protein VP01_1687g1 [Puccinia sorghi]|uniref:Uncharacterized protein n=1 Tax=Puccinia sorghi TaxID=27349 RepID=A0A0L6VFT5_9BASI|nr:hypothetical protein VP01_1687g1 [Puccinia sorghi]